MDNELPSVDASNHPYSALTPEVILQAVESLGLLADGRFYPLNSYENRVYQIWLESGEIVVAKFYRPGRWSREAILEEHAIAQEFVDQELPVVAPAVVNQQTLHDYQGFQLAIYPRQGGRAPAFDNNAHLEQLGRLVGRLHAIGARYRFEHRVSMSVQRFGWDNLTYLKDHDWVPAEMAHNFYQTVEQAVQLAAQQTENLFSQPGIRLHGDLHAGNILWTDAGPHLVDLDDCMQGPAVQDIWMFLSGEKDDVEKQTEIILNGYSQFHDFDYASLDAIESLRTLRMLNYTAWLARRWQDPAFPHHFPWFNTPNYWQEQLNQMREQVERLRMALERD